MPRRFQESIRRKDERRSDVVQLDGVVTATPQKYRDVAAEFVRVFGLSALFAGVSEPAFAGGDVSSASETAESRVDSTTHMRAEEADLRLLRETVSEERIRLYEQIVEAFPVKKALDALAEVSLIPAGELYERYHLTRVIAYSPETIVASQEEIDAHLVGMTADEFVGYVAKVAGFSLEDTLIGINVGLMSRGVDEDASRSHFTPKQANDLFAMYVEATLAHEFVHAVDGVDRKSLNVREASVYEGLVDAVSTHVSQLDATPSENQRIDSLPHDRLGYTLGSREAGRFLMVSLGFREVIQHVLRGDFARIRTMFDTKYGPGSWKRACETYVPSLVGRPRARIEEILPLFSFMRTAHDSTEVVRTMNEAWIRLTVLPIVDAGRLVGVAVRDHDADVLTNGLVLSPLGNNRVLVVDAGDYTALEPFQYQDPNPKNTLTYLSETMRYPNDPSLSDEQMITGILDFVHERAALIRSGENR